jgi:hypothetical protein
LILALPRAAAESSALDRFLKIRKPGWELDLVFLYEDPGLGPAAQTCAGFYGQRPGVQARRLRVGTGE